MTEAEFDIFRDAAWAWLAAAPALDAPLAAAVDVLAQATSVDRVRQLALDSSDTHTTLGAHVVLDLFQAATGSFSPASPAG